MLGIPLFPNTGGSPCPNSLSPSLDKIKPHLGYVPGNVLVVSHRANMIKHDATPEELSLLATNLQTIVTR